ncbi:hypothetical protein [Microbacterium paludicola]|uniref:hypothetical protein n=1 Tax=Microbacterium paludicola TaxID=300019 RepID=UPI0031DA44E1
MSSVLPLAPSAPARAVAAPALLWKQADEDVYVATVDDEFAGYIAVTDSGYALHSAHAEPLGVYRSRRDAQDALHAHLAPAAASRPRTTAAGRRRRSRARTHA